MSIPFRDDPFDGLRLHGIKTAFVEKSLCHQPDDSHPIQWYERTFECPCSAHFRESDPDGLRFHYTHCPQAKV